MPLPFDPVQPFALLWDGFGKTARLFQHPQRLIAGTDTKAGLQQLRAAAAAGAWLAGGFSFEAGYQLEDRLVGLEIGPPFHWFGVFDAPDRLTEADLAAFLNQWRTPIGLGTPEPLLTKDEWLSAVAKVKALIAAGDIYQANLTFQARLPFRGHPMALFARLFNARAFPHGGLVHDGAGRWWVSLSPELFFSLSGGELTGKPMKGTARRLPTAQADRQAAITLAHDPKNRAENLMITDLIRNDMSRVAVSGSVQVPSLFTVETYPSVHQMTSTVTAALQPGLDALDVLQVLFPCGSITGAPRIRAMEIIADVERQPRGIYCGSLGWIAPGGQSAQFNVAIRTIEIDAGAARIGLGAGIVADSDPGEEWAECLIKSRFLKRSAPDTLIETMRIEADGTIPRKALHLARLVASARHFGWNVDSASIEARLQAIVPERPRRLRLLLSAHGDICIHLSDLPATPVAPVPVAVVPLPVDPGDWRLAHKTADRQFYDEARRRSGSFECLFVRADGRLTEGSFTTLFVKRGGRLLTPPLSRGLLPGVLRTELIESRMAEEADLTIDDLGQDVLIGNSLRGLLPAMVTKR